MSTAQLTAVIESFLGFALLTVLLLKLWPAHRVTQFRQDMFTVRDELFDYAASGAIAFNDPAYRLLRQSMNGFIRYAHRLTMFQLILTMTIWRIWGSTPELSWATQWEQSLAEVHPDIRKTLTRFHEQALSLVLKRLVLGSPILMVALVVAMLYGFIKTGAHSVRQRTREYAIRSVSKIVDPRLIEEAATRLAA